MKSTTTTATRHISITMLTWDLIEEVEAITGKLVYPEDICREIEHRFYVACMNAHHSGSGRSEFESFIDGLESGVQYISDDETRAALADILNKLQPTEDETNTTTDTEKEETTMTTNERYDYMEHMTADVIEAIRERYTDDDIRARLDDDRDEFAQNLNDDLWIDDSVTGNGSGSYYCNAWRAEEAIAHNWDLIADMIDEFDAADILRKGPEAIDVSIRCYLLYQAIDAALDQLDEDIPEAEEIDEDDDTNDADAISA